MFPIGEGLARTYPLCLTSKAGHGTPTSEPLPPPLTSKSGGAEEARPVALQAARCMNTGRFIKPSEYQIPTLTGSRGW